MQTYCPHCKTHFRVTETQINISEGDVRCGICKEVFNVFEVASKRPLEQNHQQSLSNNNCSDKFSSAMVTDTEIEQANFSDTQAEALENNTNSYIEIQADNESVSFDENKRPSTNKSANDSLDFFNEEINESLPHVVPEKFRESHTSNSHSAASTALWSISTLLLTASLLLEYLWFNRDQYNQSPELQVVIEKLCQQIECNKISIRDPSKIELIARNIYSHPNEKDALMIDITMRNNASFSQPYPVMSISFSDIRGNAVASRHFLPNEYLPIEYKQGNNKQQDLLRPDTNTSLTLEIQDPGKQAKTYEFNFL